MSLRPDTLVCMQHSQTECTLNINPASQIPNANPSHFLHNSPTSLTLTTPHTP
jgi:hypothetical protein